MGAGVLQQLVSTRSWRAAAWLQAVKADQPAEDGKGGATAPAAAAPPADAAGADAETEPPKPLSVWRRLAIAISTHPDFELVRGFQAEISRPNAPAWLPASMAAQQQSLWGP